MVRASRSVAQLWQQKPEQINVAVGIASFPAAASSASWGSTRRKCRHSSRAPCVPYGMWTADGRLF